MIPAKLRQALGVQTGDRLFARQVGNSLVLERRDEIIQRLQQRFAHIPGSLADELIAERREAAAQG